MPASRGLFHGDIMDRIIIHWTGGALRVSALDREHYHFIIDGAGIAVEGDHAPEANLRISGAGGYAAHTLNCNTGSIGVAVAGMLSAREAPFDAGSQPINEVQIEALAQLVANLCRRYSIPVSRATVLTHAEVQPTLGVRQRGKWDITWLPGMEAAGDPIDVGDVLRAKISAALGQGEAVSMPTLQRGAKGEPVRRLQASLRGAGFGPARIDGDFGPATDAAARRFQSAKGLWPDGIVGPRTWAKLNLKG